MNAGTCWGKNMIDPRAHSVEKPRKSDFNFNLTNLKSSGGNSYEYFCVKELNFTEQQKVLSIGAVYRVML
jgi:hypothetical protein